ncbi:DUF3501 family protein [Thalassotalea mangrovi]|uniref:DUF3501 family protein n=1 Tax=Thalassotalea mangrovi TaxID=2572245 RepID=A0A4U1B328_9GAMM|nr:DUF3501 family protein [Thalassotalea mangrovi]TKB43460.1 DUF3501 family protein [Thalassotalea mangrovi]
MEKLNRQQLWSLEDYAQFRPAFRSDVMAHKKNRQLTLAEHLRLLFEDRKTIQYQIQEMLRIERIFEAKAINEELEAYNPLIPDGCNLKATMLIEYEDVEDRKVQLAKLLDIEKSVYIKVGDFDNVYPICNEDLDRQTEEKTSSVHFLRFEFTKEMISAWYRGESVVIGVEHRNFPKVHQPLPEHIKSALQADFDPPPLPH